MAADWARTPFGEPDERYRWNVSVAWRWLVGGVLAIAVGLAVWPTTFILVPTGAVLVTIGATKLVRSIWASHSRSP
jgi:hypothetical protein